MYFRMEKWVGVEVEVEGVEGMEEVEEEERVESLPLAPRPKQPGNDNLMWHHLSIVQASFRHCLGIIPNKKQYDAIPSIIHFLPCAANTIFKLKGPSLPLHHSLYNCIISYIIQFFYSSYSL